MLLSTWYVSTSGSDGDPGSLGEPFRTIQQAANRAQPGDVVFVRGGVYRETVKPARSGTASGRITFRPYESESVTISGADPLPATWRNHSGSVYKVPQDWDLGEGNNQVFVDGRMMLEARWPNTPSLDVSRPRRANADAVDAVFAGQASYATLTDSELNSFPDGAWDGGVLHIASGQSWVTQFATVTDSGSGRLSFDYVQRTSNPKSDRFETPEAGDPYYLTGKFVALDSPGEWFRDDGDGTLYLWTPKGDSPSSHAVEAKARKYAFDLTGRAYVDVEGFNLFASTIVTDSASTAVNVDGINAQYVGHFSTSDTGWEVPLDSGIYLAGDNSALRNSTIAYGAGHGVNVTGSFSRVENNVIRDVAYAGANGSGVRVAGTGHVLRSNTIYDAGRTGILHTRLFGGRIVHNVIHDVMLQTTDGGGTYTYGTDGGGTEIAYNKVYNVNTGGFGGVGVYLDNGSSNHLVHHNLVWNVNHGLKLNPTSQYNQFYNNTLVANSRGVATSGSRDMTGSVFRNNIFTKAVDIGATAVQEANVYASNPPQFADPSRNDYRLQPTSPAVDKGVKLPPYTDGYAGGGPDAGALEYGRAAWDAGADDGLTVPDGAAPAAPRGLTATASAAGVTLDWLDAPGADRFGYHVYRAPAAGGPFARINDALVTTSRHLDSEGQLDATAHYRVVTVDTSGNTSAHAAASAFLPTPPAVPAAPGALVLTPSSASAIDLAWPGPPDVSGYRVERRGPGEPEFREIARTTLPLFRDAGLAANAVYAYRVRAENRRGTSSPGAAVSGAPLSTPAALRVAVVSGTRTDLSWTNVTGETRFDVQRSPDGRAGWLTIAATTPDVTSYADVSVPTGEPHFYRVVAVGAAGQSHFSAAVGTSDVSSAYDSADVNSAPEGRTTVVAADTAFDVVAGGRNIYGTSDGFRFVYKAFAGDFDVKVRVTALAAVVSTSKAGLMARESLHPTSRNVFAHATASGELRYSRRSETAGGTTIFNPALRSTFPDLWVRLVRRGDAFTAYGSADGVTWSQTGSDTLAMPRTVLVGMAASAQSTTQTTTARFRELAESDTPAPVPPDAPGSLSAAAVTPTVVELEWPAAAGATSYAVERQASDGSSFSQIASNVAGTSYRDTGRSPQAKYVYRVRAQNAAGRSGYSPTAEITTPAALPDRPTDLVATAVSSARVDVEWDPVAGAASYRLERKGPGETGFREVAAGLTGSSYTDPDVRPESPYAYRVRAENAAGFSPYSESASATTPAGVRRGYVGSDVGDPSPGPGSTAEVVEGRDYDLVGGGSDVNGTSDRFHFAHRPLAGDFDVRVRLQSLGRANPWTKAGLMARESLTAGSVNVFVLATPDANGHRFSARFSDGGGTLVSGTGPVTYPNNWLRLRRVGSVFTGYRSADGVNWVPVASRNVGMSDTVYFGMAVTSHNTSATTAAQFRDLSGVSADQPVVPPAPAGLAAIASSATQVDLAWEASAGATGYRVERRGPGETAFKQVAITAATTYVDADVAPSSAYAYRVRAANAAGASQAGDASSVTTPAAAEPLTGADVGGPTPGGSTTEVRRGTDYDLVAGGTDVNGATDRFHFAHKRVTGDFDVKVRLESLGSSHDWAKAGIMAREDLTGGSRNVFALATPGPNGHRVSSRSEANGSTFVNGSGAVSYPNTWLRLRRRGSNFTAYRSNDGSNWAEIGATRTIALPDTLYLGLAATSHNTLATTTARFRDFGDV